MIGFARTGFSLCLQRRCSSPALVAVEQAQQLCHAVTYENITLVLASSEVQAETFRKARSTPGPQQSDDMQHG